MGTAVRLQSQALGDGGVIPGASLLARLVKPLSSEFKGETLPQYVGKEG